jgi:hypothetical protein
MSRTNSVSSSEAKEGDDRKGISTSNANSSIEVREGDGKGVRSLKRAAIALRKLR